MDRKKQVDRKGRAGRSISRRDFIRYSSLAITTAALPKIFACSSYQPPGDCLIKEVQPVRESEGKQVFEGSHLAGVKIMNRIIRSATTLGLADETGRPTDELIEKYIELAQGGVGAIITGFVAIQRNGMPATCNALMIDGDEYVDDYRRVADIVHKHNTPIFMQLAHSGRQTRSALTGQATVAPSALKSKYYNEEVPRELTEPEIYEIIDNFVLAIERAEKAGFDGVQLHAAHGYLLSEFLSPDMNRREDRWGGTTENRGRILREIIEKARKRVGDYPILVKLNGYDFQPHGMRVEEAAKIASMLQAAGCDGIEVSCGVVDDGLSTIRGPEVPVEAALEYSFRLKDKPALIKKMIPAISPLFVKPYEPVDNYNVCAAMEIKERVDIPVIAVGGIKDLGDIREIIQGNMADYVGMSRAFIIEPDIVNLFQAELSDASECISCCYCIVSIEEKPIECYYGEL